MRLPPAIEMPDAPAWLKDFDYHQREFTFVRIKYAARLQSRGSHWATDYPDADLAVASQVKALTKLDVKTPSSVLSLTSPELHDHRIAYVGEAGMMQLSESESTSLRKFCDQGGLLLMDDTWGDSQLTNVLVQLKSAFPDQSLKRLGLDHPIFHNVFDLKQLPQSISIHSFLAAGVPNFERELEPKFLAIMDKDNRIQVLVCHNNDLGDGWERAKDSKQYCDEISRPHAFPMVINVIHYALTK